MYEFHPYYTADGSVGLYNQQFNDIYHSATGALTEAIEKFIDPVDYDLLLRKDSIKVLDICYGIGYNSKSFINKINSLTETNIAPIYTNKISGKNNTIYNAKIYDDNIFGKISITAIDNDKNLAFLSPFIKTGEKHVKNKNFDFEYKNLKKYLKENENIEKPKINKLINFLIFQKISQEYPYFLQEPDLECILTNSEYNRYFDADLKAVYKLYKSTTDNNNPITNLSTFIHNIYYHHISKRMEKVLKGSKLQECRFNLKIGDARDVIKQDKNLYNLIFLDAFTPSKCPCLWSYEFFKLLYEHLEDDGMILTYSSSASVRGAMIEAGFHIGENFNAKQNKSIGTIASKNINLIKHPLSEFDLGLLKTTAGIFYRDKNLTGLNEAIIARRNLEVKNSTRISSSQYKKIHKY